jgi:uncharacterized damage-inducible protein DinB
MHPEQESTMTLRHAHRVGSIAPVVLSLLVAPRCSQPAGDASQPADAAASTAATSQTAALKEDLLKDLNDVEKKLVDLAEAIPEAKYGWTPGPGVRSVSEVFVHVAADNYFIPAMAGTAAPAATGINGSDYKTVQAYEGRKMTKAEAIAEVKASFAHLKQALTDTPDARFTESIDMFGQSNTVRGMWILATTHVHEHLGQLIAYARSNSVVPPWST